MTIVHHDEHLHDRAAMLAMRATLALHGSTSSGPDARPDFDVMMARTPEADGVEYEPATVGGVAGWWCRPSAPRGEGVILHLHGGAYVLGSAAADPHVGCELIKPAAQGRLQRLVVGR